MWIASIHTHFSEISINIQQCLYKKMNFKCRLQNGEPLSRLPCVKISQVWPFRNWLDLFMEWSHMFRITCSNGKRTGGAPLLKQWEFNFQNIYCVAKLLSHICNFQFQCSKRRNFVRMYMAFKTLLPVIGFDVPCPVPETTNSMQFIQLFHEYIRL